VANKFVEEVVGFIDAFKILPQHVSFSQCHHQGAVFTSEAAQAISVLWMNMDYNLSGVAGCRGMRHGRKSTTQILVE
jgi:hypothetical protein